MILGVVHRMVATGGAAACLQSDPREFVLCVQCGWGALGDACGDTAVLTKASSQGKAVLLSSFVALAGGSHPPVEDRELAVAMSAALCGLEDKGVEPRKQAGELLTQLAAAGVAALPPAVAREMSSAQSQMIREKLGVPPATASAAPARRTKDAPGVGRTASGSGKAGGASRNGSRPGTAYSEDGARGSAHGESRQTSGSGSSRRASVERGGRLGRHESRERNASTTPRPGRGRAAPVAAADDDVLISLNEAGTKEERKVAVRSFKYEARIGEAKLVQASLAPLLSTALADLMFSDEFKKHCMACDQLSVRTPAWCLLQSTSYPWTCGTCGLSVELQRRKRYGCAES